MNIILFIFGLLVGSLLNVLAVRYKEDGKIFERDRVIGRSACPHCKKVLKSYELIPLLSYIFQLGKCRSCKNRLSIQYPLSELITATLTVCTVSFLLSFYPINLDPAFGSIATAIFIAIWLLIIYTLILLSLIDLRLKIIPDQINVFLFFLALPLLFIKSNFPNAFLNQGSFLAGYGSIINPISSVWLNAGFAAVFGAIFFGLIIAVTKGRGMGMGDLKLVIPLGLILGWPDIVLMISLSFIIGTIFSLPLLIFKKKTFKAAIPFGPFLVMAFFVTIIYGEALLRWYFALL
ncbi:MAG: prepilin peptidase [bacterium]|nr:prepilin peptidase [bacterium]